MIRPKDRSQCGRILRLLESARGGKVSLLAILSLHVSQYSARIYELRHRYGFRIENGSEPGKPDHTWFRLVDKVPAPTVREDKAMPHKVETSQDARLFSVEEMQRGRWKDEG